MNRVIQFLFFGLLLWASLSAFSFKSPYIYSIRQGGLGNSFTAIADDEYLLLANPAGLGVKRKFLKTKDGESIDYLNIIKVGAAHVSDLDHLYNSYSRIDFNNQSLFDFLKYFDKKNLSLKAGAIAYSHLTNTWGITVIPVLINNRKLAIINDLMPTYYNNIFETTQLSVGFKPLSIDFFDQEDNLHFGFALRGFYLLEIDSKVSSSIIKSMSVNDLNYNEGLGMALDLGILWENQFSDGHKFNIGLAVTDGPGIYYPLLTSVLLSPESDQSVKFMQPNPKVGFAYFLPNYLESYMADTVFSLDIHRWVDTTQSLPTKFHLGIGTSIIKFPTLNINVNVGINGGYFTISTIFYVFRVRLSYLLYQEELGVYSGSNPYYQHEFSFSLYF